MKEYIPLPPPPPCAAKYNPALFPSTDFSTRKNTSLPATPTKLFLSLKVAQWSWCCSFFPQIQFNLCWFSFSKGSLYKKKTDSNVHFQKKPVKTVPQTIRARAMVQGGLFNCPPPKISKCRPVSKFFQKKLEYPDCPPPKISKCQTGKENSDT